MNDCMDHTRTLWSEMIWTMQLINLLKSLQFSEDHYRRRGLFDQETSKTILVSPTGAKHHRFDAGLMIIFKP